ncbi:MAG TPA: glycosyltransferase family 87 protein [Candidatus Limnocylindria bacterium]
MRIRSSSLVVLTAVAFLLADATLIWIGAQADFAFDFTCCYQQAAGRALFDPSTLYDWSDTYTFRYTPIGALPFAPLVGLSEQGAAWSWLVAKVVVLGVAAAWFAQPWSGRQRWLVIGLVVTFPPIVHDLVIGNVSTITFLVLLAVARWPDARGGVALGLLTVLMPKPHLIPILAYLAIRRPRQFLAAAATMAAGVVFGISTFGIEPWIAFVGTLREPLERTFTANVGFSGLLGQVGVVVGVVVALVVFAAAIRLGGSRGYGLAILSGILAGPYTFIHYLAGSLVAAEPVLRTGPRRLAPFPWVLVAFPLIPIGLSALAALLYRSDEPEAEPPAAAPD